MEHKLKILPQYLESIVEGTKNFEIRKNDRNYQVGDTLILKEWVDREIRQVEDITIEASPYFTGLEITKEITYILEGGQYGLEEGYCILGLKQEGIKLQNINLTAISVIEQINKVKEEEMEFMVAIELENKENAIEEFFDTIQSKLGLLEKVFGIKADEVTEQYPKHLEKLKNRPRRDKQWNI